MTVRRPTRAATTRTLAVVAALAVGLSACSGGSGDSASGDGGGSATTEAGKLTVWLQVDAQQNWPAVVEAATAATKAKHPGAEISVQYQPWNAHLTKLDAALTGNDVPDVVEMGNTEMAKYMAAGAFADLTDKKGSFENSGTWLQSLQEAASYQGKLYGVPYYAGARAVIYRKDLFEKAGVEVPTSLAEFETAAETLMKANAANPKFSAFYLPGKNWYAAMAWVKDFGGEIATEADGKWTGALDSAQSQEALTELKSVIDRFSKADKSGDEATQPQTFAQGNVAMMYANGWEWGSILDPKTGNPDLKDKLGAFPMPSKNAGQLMPAFLGGSVLAVPAASKNQQLAADWIAAFTSTESSTELAKVGKVIPNTTTLVDINASDPQLAPFAKAATNSWFVPSSPNWANVESGNILQDMLVSIWTEKASVADATTSASEKITTTLNEGQ